MYFYFFLYSFLLYIIWETPVIYLFFFENMKILWCEGTTKWVIYTIKMNNSRCISLLPKLCHLNMLNFCIFLSDKWISICLWRAFDCAVNFSVVLDYRRELFISFTLNLNKLLFHVNVNMKVRNMKIKNIEFLFICT